MLWLYNRLSLFLRNIRWGIYSKMEHCGGGGRSSQWDPHKRGVNLSKGIREFLALFLQFLWKLEITANSKTVKNLTLILPVSFASISSWKVCIRDLRQDFPSHVSYLPHPSREQQGWDWAPTAGSNFVTQHLVALSWPHSQALSYCEAAFKWPGPYVKPQSESQKASGKD